MYEILNPTLQISYGLNTLGEWLLASSKVSAWDYYLFAQTQHRRSSTFSDCGRHYRITLDQYQATQLFEPQTPSSNFIPSPAPPHIMAFLHENKLDFSQTTISF